MDTKRQRYLAKKQQRRQRARSAGFGPCDCGCGGESVVVPPERVFEFLEAQRCPDDIAAMEDCLAAEARGDAPAALDAYRRGLHIVGSPREVMLETLTNLDGLGISAASASGRRPVARLFARWIVAQGYQWMLLRHDPRTDKAVCMTLAACYEVPDSWDPRTLLEVGTGIAGCDWVTHQLATYDMGGLADYLDTVIDDDFKARVPMIDEWVRTPLRAYTYDDANDMVVGITEVRTGERFEVLNRGCLEGAAIGAFVLGRVVPAMPGGPLMFADRPLNIDEQTARAIGRWEGDDEVPGWLLALASAFDDGRQSEGIGRGNRDFLSDAPFEFRPEMDQALRSTYGRTTAISRGTA